MRCMTSSQTAKGLLQVISLLWLLIVATMEGCPRAESRSSQDPIVPRSGQDAEDDADMLFDEDSRCSSLCAKAASPHSSPLGLTWDVSCLPMEIEAALSASLTSKTLTPLLKEELRCKIQLRRLQHGEEEITSDFSTKPFSMSMEELVKKNKKMQQNRMSAQRSRDRQKSLEKKIQSRLELLEKENNQLTEEARCLRHACHVARNWLQQHHSCTQQNNVPWSQKSASLLTHTSGKSSDPSSAHISASVLGSSSKSIPTANDDHFGQTVAISHI